MRKHIIKNFEELINIREDWRRKGRKEILEILEKGLEKADPEKAMKRHLKLKKDRIEIKGEEIALNKFKRIFVVGGGKASAKMAKAVEEILEDRIYKGLIIAPENVKSKTKIIEIRMGDHPIPSRRNIQYTREIIELLKEAGREDLIIILLSGGGSALLTYPADELELEDIAETTRILLKCGANIEEINTIRKHISKIKGGQLVKYAYPARTITLIISDVVGNRMDSIASGPTVPDKTTFKDAERIIKKYNLYGKLPENVINRIIRGVKGKVEETPKPGNPLFKKVINIIVANNFESLKTMKREAKRRGYRSMILSSRITGEAKEIGRLMAAIFNEVRETGNPIKAPAIIIGGGETTVTVKGNGIGGRNQELALTVANIIGGNGRIFFASIGTDGIDGVTDAAGAIVDAETKREGEELGLSIEETLKNNDSYSFFKKVGKNLIYTGLTETNVNDLMIGLILK